MGGLENQLAALFVANDDFDELEQALNVFCPFEAVGMVRQEIRHGYFLRYIFDPQRPHGFGGACIRALMAAAANVQGSETENVGLLETHLADFDGAIVPQTEWRNIDILIDIPEENLVIAIELKIDASEHSGQLGRYRQIVETEWPKRRHIFLLLTKRGDEPSDDDGSGWQSVPLDLLANELRAILSRHIGSDDSRTMLKAYLAMLGRHHLNDERLEGLAARLWAKHREALEYLTDQRPDAYKKLFDLLNDQAREIADMMSTASGVTVESDFHRPAALRFAVPSWDRIDGFCSSSFTQSGRILLIEIIKASKADNKLRCYFQLGIGEAAIRQKLYDALNSAGIIQSKRGLTKDWNRLASKAFKLDDMDDAPDVEKIAAKVVPQIVEFISQSLPKFHSVLSKLG